MKLIILLLFTQLLTAQTKLLIIAIDPSRIVETNYDKGIDLELTLILDTEAFIEPLIKFEVFPNIDFYKLAVGGFYTLELNKIELSAGLEIGLIHRKKPNLKSYGSWFSLGINFQTRWYLFEKFPLVASYNIQRRTDFLMYKTRIKNVGSLFIGVGYLF